MTESKENALLYYSGFLVLKQKLDFMRSKNALKDIFGQPPFHPAVMIHESEICFFQDFGSNHIVIENGKVRHDAVACALKGARKDKIMSTLDEIYQNIVEKTISYNYGENDSVKKAFTKALLSETTRFLPLNLKDMIKNKDLERASIFLFLSELYKITDDTISDTALIDSMARGFNKLPSIFESTKACQGCMDHRVLIDHSLIKGDVREPIIKNKNLRSLLLGGSVLTSTMTLSSLDLLNMPLAFASSFTLAAGLNAWCRFKRVLKQVRSVSEQAGVLSHIANSVLEKSYLLPEEDYTNVLLAQEKTLAREKRLEYHQEIPQFVRQMIATISTMGKDKLSIFDVLGQRPNLIEIHKDALTGAVVPQLFKKYPQEDVYQWMRVVKTLECICPINAPMCTAAFLNGHPFPTKVMLANAIEFCQKYSAELKKTQSLSEQIKQMRKNILHDRLKADKDEITALQECCDDMMSLLKENPQMSAKAIQSALSKKWALTDSVILCSPNMWTKVFVRKEALADIDGKSLPMIWGYAQELAFSLKMLKKYKELSQKKPLTVDEFMANEVSAFNEVVPYQINLQKPIRIHPKTRKMLERTQMLGNILTRADN